MGLNPFSDRGRSPQPPAEEDEDDFDDTLVAIDTCESLGCLSNSTLQSVLGDWYERNEAQE